MITIKAKGHIRASLRDFADTLLGIISAAILIIIGRNMAQKAFALFAFLFQLPNMLFVAYAYFHGLHIDIEERYEKEG